MNSPVRIRRNAASSPAALLGEHLRLVRIAAGYPSQEALASAIQQSRPTINRAETGEFPPTDEVFALILNTCGVTGQLRKLIEGVWALARARENPSQYRVAPWYQTEARAHTLRYWAPIIIPGIAQTAAYAEALFTAMGFDPGQIEESLALRMGRQAILDRTDNAPDITIVLWEPVLYHQIGSREIMREQLAYLIKLSGRRPVAIHVLPSSHGASPGLGGAVQLAATDDTAELLVSDALVEDQLSQHPDVVRKARATFSSVRADSVNRAGSVALIMEAMEK